MFNRDRRSGVTLSGAHYPAAVGAGGAAARA